MASIKSLYRRIVNEGMTHDEASKKYGKKLDDAAKFISTWIMGNGGGGYRDLRSSIPPDGQMMTDVSKSSSVPKLYRGIHLSLIDSPWANAQVGKTVHINFEKRQNMAWSEDKDLAWDFATDDITGMVDYGLHTMFELVDAGTSSIVIPDFSNTEEWFNDMILSYSPSKEKSNLRTDANEWVMSMKSFTAKLVRIEKTDFNQDAIDYYKELDTDPHLVDPFIG